MTEQSAPMPDWFVHGRDLIWAVPRAVHSIFEEPRSNVAHGISGLCATIHYLHCLSLSVEANRKGQHAVAICLVRQCVEALTVIEVGLLRESDIGASLMDAWSTQGRSSGSIRRELEARVWPRYAPGLWGENWAAYFGAFCRAVQPYAHYSPQLQGWQMVLIDDSVQRDVDGSYLMLSRVGLNSYEANKATRVTCLHCLLSWTLGHILGENRDLGDLTQGISDLGTALAAADELCRGNVDWPTQFWAHEFTRPSADDDDLVK